MADETTVEEIDINTILNPTDDEQGRAHAMDLLTDGERAEITGATEEAEDEDHADTDDDAAPVPEPEPEPTPEPEPYKIPDGVLTGKALDDRLAAIQADREKAMKEFEDLDIEADDFKKIMADAAAEERKLVREAAKHEALRDRDMTLQQEKQRAENEKAKESWEASLKDYRAAYPELWADPASLKLFDDMVKSLSRNEYWAGLPDDKFLAKAHRDALEAAETAGVAIPALKAKGKEAAKPKAEPAKKELGTVPVTLAKVPSSKMTPTNDGPFGVLDDIISEGSPEDQADALNRLSPAQMEAWLSS